jgi:O-antigen/teichoic acid export membrane protein
MVKEQDGRFEQNIGKSTLILLSGTLVGTAANFAAFFALPYFLGADTYGRYVFLFAIMTNLNMLLDMGGSLIILKNVPGWRMTRPQEVVTLPGQIGGQKLIFMIPVAMVSSLALIAGYPSYFFLMLGAFFFSHASALMTYLYANGNMITRAFFPACNSLFRAACVIALARIIGGDVGISSGLVLATFLLWLGFCFTAIYAGGTWRIRKVLASPTPAVWKELMTFGLWTYLAVVIYSIWFRFPIYYAEAVGLEQSMIGCMGLALQAITLLTSTVGTITAAILPRLLQKRHLNESVEKEEETAWRLTNLFGGYCIIILSLFFPSVVSLLLGQTFDRNHIFLTTSVVMYSLPALIFLVWINFHHQLVFTLGRASKVFWSMLAGMVGFLLLYPILKQSDLIAWIRSSPVYPPWGFKYGVMDIENASTTLVLLMFTLTGACFACYLAHYFFTPRIKNYLIVALLTIGIVCMLIFTSNIMWPQLTLHSAGGYSKVMMQWEVTLIESWPLLFGRMALITALYVVLTFCLRLLRREDIAACRGLLRGRG